MMNLFITRLQSLYKSFWYPVLVVSLVLIGHTAGHEVLFGVIMLFTMALGCWISDDLRFAVTPFLCTIFCVTVEHSPNVPDYSRYYLEPQALIPIIIAFVLSVGSLICFAIRHRATAKRPSKKSMLWGLIVFCLGLLTNGLFGANYKLGNAVFAFAFLLTLVGLFYLFSSYVRFDQKTVDYFLFCFLLSGLLITLQLFIAYLTHVRFDESANPIKETVMVGWGVWTSIGGMLSFLMPAGFYFAAKYKQGWIGYLIALVELFAILLSQSRGALLIGAGVFLLCMIAVCLVGEYKKRNRMITITVTVVGIIGILILSKQLLGLLQNFIDYGFGDNGRFDMWRVGIQRFLERPFFGTGFYDSYYNQGWYKAIFPYLYHNTLIQMLGGAGIVGFLSYAYHRFCTIRLVVKTPNPCKIFLGIGILGLFTFCLIDVLFFHIYPSIFYALMLVVMDASDEIKS